MDAASPDPQRPRQEEIDALESRFASDLPRFHVGQIVKHRRYGYRGVVIDFDVRCQADEDWYMSNQTQPDRGQPWYHVLVDRAMHLTYAAQSNLQPSEDLSPVAHPLLDRFFKGQHENGLYRRNDRPWNLSEI